MLARAFFRRKRAKAIVRRQMLFQIAKMFVGSARIARKVREEMFKKNVSGELSWLQPLSSLLSTSRVCIVERVLHVVLAPTSFFRPRCAAGFKACPEPRRTIIVVQLVTPVSQLTGGRVSESQRENTQVYFCCLIPSHVTEKRHQYG